jgi:hypothetical protein
MKLELLKFNPFHGEEANSAYRVVMLGVVKSIYKSLFSLKNDLLHKSFKHQRPILGQLMALYKLHERASDHITLGLKQVNQ